MAGCTSLQGVPPSSAVNPPPCSLLEDKVNSSKATSLQQAGSEAPEAVRHLRQ
jgi:hypothetical protein